MLCHDHTTSPMRVIWPCVVIWPPSLESAPHTPLCPVQYSALFYSPFLLFGLWWMGAKNLFIFTFLQNIFHHIVWPGSCIFEIKKPNLKRKMSLIMNHSEKEKRQHKKENIVDFLLDSLTLQGCLTKGTKGGELHTPIHPAHESKRASNKERERERGKGKM